jgi:ABC-type transport system involved in cytochrome c biogenesis permease subunit
MRKSFPLIAAAIALLAVAATLLPPRSKSPYDLEEFGRLPTLVNGRIKPLDTVARTTLLVLQGRQRVTDGEGRTLHPSAWLLDMLFRPDKASLYPVFEIVHPEVLSVMRLTTEQGVGGKRFSFRQLSPGLPELDRQAKLVDAVEGPLRTPFQRAAVSLRNQVLLYQRLQYSFLDATDLALLDRLIRFERSLPEAMEVLAARRNGQPHVAADAASIDQLGRIFTTLDTFGYLLPIPGEENPSDPSKWMSAGAAWRASLTEGRVNPAVVFYLQLGAAWRDGQPEVFNASVQEKRSRLEETIPTRLAKADVEALFNRAQPFYSSSIIYVMAFLLAVFSWLRWPDALGRAAFWLTAIAFITSTAGIVVRMWLEGRPPVTNLYSSALFVGWGAVGLCLILEAKYRNAIGSVAAGLIGFSSLVVAHHLSLSGDTLEMMRAVLDSNFWLATHVVTIALGYSAMFLAGFLGLIYVVRGVFTKSLDAATASSLARMVYGVICFATFFSFIGTVLGGIWADQSWGRFWGWDPKENGALIIVLWCALVLHARWGGQIKARGLMVLAIFGNIVTAWSWFGVNMLGVGLHSYGFMDSAFWSLLFFGGSQLAVMAIAGLPLAHWRSAAAMAANATDGGTPRIVSLPAAKAKQPEPTGV